jgi:hypothetical protein
MDKSKLEIIFKTQNPIEVSMVCELLKANGIEAFILDENASRITGGIAITSKIAVLPVQKEEALEILKAFNSQ